MVAESEPMLPAKKITLMTQLLADRQRFGTEVHQREVVLIGSAAER